MSIKKIEKALKALKKIKNPSRNISDAIQLIEVELVPQGVDQIQELIDISMDRNETYEVRRQALSDALEKGAIISFNYEKKDGSSRVVNVEWNDDYTYDIPPEDSDFIYLYDMDDQWFKHFKIDKMSELQFQM